MDNNQTLKCFYDVYRLYVCLFRLLSEISKKLFNTAFPKHLIVFFTIFVLDVSNISNRLGNVYIKVPVLEIGAFRAKYLETATATDCLITCITNLTFSHLHVHLKLVAKELNKLRYLIKIMKPQVCWGKIADYFQPQLFTKKKECHF